MRNNYFMAGAILLSAAIFTGCKPKPEFAYTTAKVEQSDVVNTVTATGTIEPVISVEVGTQVSGIVNKIYVDYNSQVTAGQVIAELDRSNLESELNSAKAQLANAKAQLEGKEASLRAARASLEGSKANLTASKATYAGSKETYASSVNTVNAAKANLASLQSKLDYQRSNYQRQKALYNQGLISSDVYDQAYLAYINAQQAVTQQQENIASQQHSSASQNEQVNNSSANVTSQQQNIANQQENIKSLEKDVESQRQTVKMQEENVKKAETNLGYATITSPISGTVLSKEVEEGQTVASSFSTPTLFKIAQDLTNMQVIADVDEADIGEVKEGQRVTFTVDAYPDDTFEGEVKQVRQEATTESNVVTYEVVISAPNNDLKLKPGLTANVTIYTVEVKNVLNIPAKALKFTPSEDMLNEGETIEDCKANQKVWIKEKNVIKAVGISTGTSNGINIEVTSGLKKGDAVITDVAESTGDVETDGEDSSNPFMPHPKDKNKKDSKTEGTKAEGAKTDNKQ